MGFFGDIQKKSNENKNLTNRLAEAGNAFVMLFAAVGMVGVLGASTMTIMKGPVKSMSEVTKRTITENNMIGATKLAIIISASDPTNQGDCDGDGVIEPVQMSTAHPSMTGASIIPSTLGVTREDSWGTDMAYCTWDYGSVINGGGCAGNNRKTGGTNPDQMILAVISAGPDKTFQSSCINYVNSSTPVVNKPGGSDDLVLGYTESDAIAMSGGLWNLKSGSPDTAEISKKLEVSDGAAAQLQFDATTKTLQIGDGTSGAGLFPSIRTDSIQDYSQSGTAIGVLSPLSVTGNLSSTAQVSGAALSVSGASTQTGNVTYGGAQIASGVGTIRDAGGGWLRTYGATGWYSQTYGGGWNMSDTTYIRSYGGKSVYAPTDGTAPSFYGNNSGANYGVMGQSAGTYGVYGKTTSAGHGGVLGYDAAGSIFGILGHANAYSMYGNGLIRGTKVYVNEICDIAGGNCTAPADIGTGGGGGGSAACGGSTMSWGGGCSAGIANTPHGLTSVASDSYCCSPSGCGSSCGGKTGSATYSCDNGLWTYVSGSCGNCTSYGGSCPDGDDDGDCDESIKDLLKMKNMYKEFSELAAKLGIDEETLIYQKINEKRAKGELR